MGKRERLEWDERYTGTVIVEWDNGTETTTEANNEYKHQILYRLNTDRWDDPIVRHLYIVK